MGQSIQGSSLTCCASTRETPGPLKPTRLSVGDVKLARNEDGSVKCCEKCGISKDHSKIFENYPCKHPICIDCLSFKPTNEENYSCPVAGCQNKINIIELNKFWYDVIKEEYGEYDPFTFLTVAKISKEEKKEKEKEKPKPQPRIKGLA